MCLKDHLNPLGCCVYAGFVIDLLTRNKSYVDVITDIQNLCNGNRILPDGSPRMSAGVIDLEEYIPSLCEEGYTGPLCSICAEGWGRILHTSCARRNIPFPPRHFKSPRLRCTLPRCRLLLRMHSLTTNAPIRFRPSVPS